MRIEEEIDTVTDETTGPVDECDNAGGWAGFVRNNA